MSTEQIKIGLVVNSNGTTEAETKKAEKLGNLYDKISKAASNLGGTAGSRSMAAKAAPTGSQALLDDKQYNQLRGAAQATGASARDFAAQAQGLGGLVRAYATFAANIFAVSAAFNALKNAADTTNLVKGLDALGAASGRSLGSLSKRLVEVTDGAISLREAMTATAQASSAGMTNANIERLTLVAKNASLALGISMPDALSRLSRGITKLEPELLDELGLFTKIGPATEEYARQLGKSASQLTDFERRQAFANAVIKEGEDKFSALNAAAANPYDKLLSTVKNAGNSILSVINAIITPFVSFLANNPVVVIAGLIASAGALIKRALPDVFASFDRIAAANTKALENSRARIAAINAEVSALEAQKKADEAAAQAATRAADARLNATDRAEAAAAAVRGEKGRAKKLDDILGTVGYEDITKSQLAELRKEALSAKNKKAAKGYEDLANSIEEYQQALVKEAAAIEKSAASKQKLSAAEAKVKQDTKELIALTQQAALSTARKNAMDTVQQQGILKVGTAIKDLNTDLKYLDVSRTERLSEIFKFIGGALSGGFDKILGVFNKLSIYVTAIIGAWQFLDGIFSTNKAQLDKLNSSLTTLEENARTVSATIATTYDKSGAAISSIKSVNALSTAMNELNDSTNAVQVSFKAVQKASSGWDKFWDSIFDLAGFGIDTKLAKSMATSIKSSFQLLSRAGLGSDFETSVKSILKVDNLVDEGQLAAAYKRLTDEQKKAIDKLREDANRQLGNTAAALQNFKDKTAEATKLYKDFVTSYRDTSPLFKLGEALVDVGLSIQKIIDADPKRLSEAFDDLVKNSDKVVLFGDVFVKTFVSIGQAVAVAVKNTEAVTEAIRQYGVVQKDLQKSGFGAAQARQAMAVEQGFSSRSFPTVNFAGTNTGTYVQGAKQVGEFGPDFIREFKRELSRNADVVNKGNAALISAQKEAIGKGLELIGASVAQAVRQGNIEVAKTIVSNFTGARKAEADTALAKQELQIQIDTIMMAKKMAEVQFSLVDQTKIANALQEEANELLRLSNLQNADKKDAKAIEAQKEKVQAAQLTTAKQKFAMGGQGALTQEELARIDPKDLANLAAQRSSQLSVFNQGFNAPLATLAAKGRSLNISGQFASTRGEAEDTQKSLEAREKINSALQSSVSLLDSINNGQNEGVILARQQLDQEALRLRQNREIASINEKIKLDQQALTAAEEQRAKAPKNATKEQLKELDKIVAGAEEELRLSKERKTTVEQTQAIETDTAALKQQIELNKLAVYRIDLQQKAYENQQGLDKTKLDTELQIQQLRFDTEQGVQAAQLKNLQLSDSQKATIEYQSALRQASLELEAKKIQANAELARKQALFTFEFNKALAADTGDGEGGLSSATRDRLNQLNAARQQDIASAKSSVQIAEEQYNKTVTVASAVKDAAIRQDEWNQKLQLASNIAESLRGAFEGATGALGQFGQNLGSVVEALTNIGNLTKQNSDNLKNNAAQQSDVNAKLSSYYEVMDNGGKLSDEEQKKFDTLSSRKIELIGEESALKKKSERDELAGNTKLVGSVKSLFGQKTTAYKALAAVEKAMHVARLVMDVKELASKMFTATAATGAVVASETAQTAASQAGIFARLSGYAAEIYGKTIGQLGPIAGPVVATALVASMFSMFGKSGSKAAPAGFGAEAAQKVQGTGQAYDASGNIVTRSGGVTGDPTERADSIVSSIEILNTNVFNMLGSKSSTIAKLLSGIKDNTAVFALSLRGRLPGYANMLAPEQVSDTTGTMSTLGLGLGGAAGFKLGGFFGGPFGALVGGAIGALAGALFGTKTTRSVEDSGINISGTAGGLGRGVGTFENYANIKTTKKSFFGGTRVSYAMQAEQMAQDSINAASRIITGINDALVLAGDALEGSGSRVVDLLDQIPIQIKVSAKGLSAKEYAEAVTAEISVQLNSAAEQVFPYLVQYNKIGEEMYETVSRIVSEGESLSYGLKMIGGAITETNVAAKVAKQQDLINYLGGIKEAGDSINYYFENFISAEEQYRFNLGRLTTAFTDASLTLPKTKKEFSALVDSVKNVDSDEARQTLATLLTYSEDFDKLLGASNDLRAEELKNLEDSASKLRDYAKSLREFNKSLVTGSLSIATPLEKFAQLQAEFTSASGLAKTGDLAALGKLQGLSQDLLTSGKELWASGPKYAELFGTVTATLADVANFADAKADVQELQLTALKDTVSLLSNIDANIASLTGGTALQTAATGGYRSGLTLVGELGPELVDFQTPGRVYTADQTAGMFAQAPNGQQFNLVVAELQQLRQEVATLRKDQQRQTGDLIVTNYDATNKLAEQITDAVVQTVTDSNWQNRSKPQIK